MCHITGTGEAMVMEEEIEVEETMLRHVHQPGQATGLLQVRDLQPGREADPLLELPGDLEHHRQIGRQHQTGHQRLTDHQVLILLQQDLVHMAEADVLWVAAVVDSEAAITVEDVNLPG